MSDFMGKRVRDKVTGFEGTAIAEVRYVTGCVRWEVVPKVDKDGKFQDACYFDDDRLELMDDEKVKVKTRKTGGYQPDPPRS